jgi:hypothetical protein
MGLKESLRELQKNEKLSVRKEVKKELTRIKKTQKKTCTNCREQDAHYFIKGSLEGYCKDCAQELFGGLGHLERVK